MRLSWKWRTLQQTRLLNCGLQGVLNKALQECELQQVYRKQFRLKMHCRDLASLLQLVQADLKLQGALAPWTKQQGCNCTCAQ